MLKGAMTRQVKKKQNALRLKVSLNESGEAIVRTRKGSQYPYNIFDHKKICRTAQFPESVPAVIQT